MFSVRFLFPLSSALLIATFAFACSKGANLAPVGSASGAGGAVGGGGSDGGTAGTDPLGGAAGSGKDPSLGKPCSTDADCGDDVSCTLDLCDMEQGRCKNTPDDSVCADDSACNGSERCDPVLGCRPGTPITCSDGEPCTIDKCVEDEKGLSCVHLLRDADGDGDPDIHCGGTDCDDTNSTISGKVAEICTNLIDDNCNNLIDEEGCIQPANDGCNDPLLLEKPGFYSMSMAGAKLDTSSTCAPVTIPSLRDVVAGLTVPSGPPRRVDVRVTWPYGINAVSLGKQCGVAAEEMACSTSRPNTSTGGQIAWLRAHSVEPGVYPLLVYGSEDFTASITYELSDPTTPPSNETCGTAAPLKPNTPVKVPLVGATSDIPILCGSKQSPDLVYRVDLDQAYDLRAFASPSDGIGAAIVSIRSEACSEAQDELTCASGAFANAFVRKLGPGPVYIAVASAGNDVDLLVTLAPPTNPPADESCQGSPPPLEINKDRWLDLTDHTDDHTFCSVGYPDAVFSLPLKETSDVLLILKTSNVTSGTLSLAKNPCDPSTNLLACKSGYPSPMRTSVRGVPPGAYRVITELNKPTPAELTPLVRKSTAPVLIPFADTCEDAFLIPPEGGSFQGNTANVNANYSASCDQGNAVNSPDQMLRLELAEKKRVIFDMNGSAFSTLLDIRKGPDCPGKEVNLGCTIGTLPQRSFLDLTLDPGSYFVQIDGFNGSSGAWFLDVFVIDP